MNHLTFDVSTPTCVFVGPFVSFDYAAERFEVREWTGEAYRWEAVAQDRQRRRVLRALIEGVFGLRRWPGFPDPSGFPQGLRVGSHLLAVGALASTLDLSPRARLRAYVHDLHETLGLNDTSNPLVRWLLAGKDRYAVARRISMLAVDSILGVNWTPDEEEAIERLDRLIGGWEAVRFFGFADEHKRLDDPHLAGLDAFYRVPSEVGADDLHEQITGALALCGVFG